MIKSWTHFHGAPGASGEKVRPRCVDLSDKQADQEQHWFSKCGPQANIHLAGNSLGRRILGASQTHRIRNSGRGSGNLCINKHSCDSDTDDVCKPLV